MSIDDNENGKIPKKKEFEEKILDGFPEDMRPGYEHPEVDILNASFAEILGVSGIHDVVDRMVNDPEQKKFANSFLEGLIKKNSVIFETIRERLKDDSLRSKLFKEMIERNKNVK